MSLLSDIKNLLKKYLKNPVIVVAGAYLLWRYINKQKKKTQQEWLSERITILEDKNNYSLIFDDRINKYILIYNDRVFSSNNVDKLRDMLK